MRLLTLSAYNLYFIGNTQNCERNEKPYFENLTSELIFDQKMAKNEVLTNPLIIGKMARIENEILRDSIDCVTIKIE